MAEKKAYPDFTKIFTEFKAPSFDLSGMAAVQRQNLEAFTAIGQAYAESSQAFSRRATEIAQQQVEDAIKNAKEIMSAGSPEAGAAKQADFTKAFMTRAFNNFREFAEMASKSNTEVTDVISDRVTKSIEEMSKAMKKAA